MTKLKIMVRKLSFENKIYGAINIKVIQSCYKVYIVATKI